MGYSLCLTQCSPFIRILTTHIQRKNFIMLFLCNCSIVTTPIHVGMHSPYPSSLLSPTLSPSLLLSPISQSTFLHPRPFICFVSTGLEPSAGGWWFSCERITEDEDCPSPRIHRYIVPQEEVVMHKPLPDPWLTVDRPILCRLSAGNSSHCEIVFAMAVPCPDVSFSQPFFL